MGGLGHEIANFTAGVIRVHVNVCLIVSLLRLSMSCKSILIYLLTVLVFVTSTTLLAFVQTILYTPSTKHSIPIFGEAHLRNATRMNHSLDDHRGLNKFQYF